MLEAILSTSYSMRNGFSMTPLLLVACAIRNFTLVHATSFRRAIHFVNCSDAPDRQSIAAGSHFHSLRLAVRSLLAVDAPKEEVLKSNNNEQRKLTSNLALFGDTKNDTIQWSFGEPIRSNWVSHVFHWRYKFGRLAITEQLFACSKKKSLEIKGKNKTSKPLHFLLVMD